VELPIGLRSALETGSAVLFVGAGVGHHARGRDGRPAPDASELARELAGRFEVNYEGEPDLAQIAEIVVLRKKGRDELHAFLRERLSDLEPDEDLVWLFSLTWKAIYTTNYDRLIQRAYELVANPTQEPVTMAESSELRDFDPKFQVPVYHLHGSLFEGREPFALICQTDYARFKESRRMLYEVLQQQYATNPILYVGYSHRDPDWHTISEELREEFQPSIPPESYRVTPSTPPLEREILESQRVHSLDGNLTDFRVAVAESLGELRVEPHSLASLRESVPTDLQPAFTENPAGAVRLVGSWDYMNQAAYHDPPPNVEDFLRGDQPTWALIAQGLYFERDVEALLLDECVDFSTSPDREVRVLSLLAPAGYGTTTVLKALAVSLVNETDNRVFFHKPGRPFLEGDIEFAARLGSDPTFVIVDNAGDHVTRLATIINRLRQLGANVCLILGERLNEWRQAHPRFQTIEFGIEPLSDGEIDRLLECLSRNGALGVLKDLTRSLQVSAIKSRHNKELLVAMREATEGRAFDAIIEDEYRSIASEDGRRLYAAVSAFYRLRAYARDQVLARMLGRNFANLYEGVGDETEGVVEFELMDEAVGIYAARTRHHIIAHIVWERCLEEADRRELLMTAMNSLNLNYSLDVQAFDHFVQDDDAVDSIRSFEDKVRFFEDALNKDPRNPYVLQHYARMLRRAGQQSLALDQIRKAIELGPDVRVLYHTQGLVLSDLALDDSISWDVRRRRLVQSEGVFRHTIALGKRDEHGYHGLAQLYLGWAKAAPSEAETADYIRKAEEVIAEGLKHVRVREPLWIVSSEVYQWLGNHPAAMTALESAVASTPGGIWGRYVLGRLHLERGNPQKAVEILAPLVEQAPEEVRPCLTFAQAQYRSGVDLKQCIATLRLCSPHGLRYPKYLATLGGMLTAVGEFTEAKQVFGEHRKRGFGFREVTQVQFKILEDDRVTPARFEGRVLNVTAGYSFIGTASMPDFFYPGSKVGDEILRLGMEVSFVAGFTAKGGQATSVQVVNQTEP
jgi:tetratricopeptide (TPR) repeat protein